MNTVLLVEACLLGCVVLSLQPGLRLPDALPTNRWGASQAVFREQGVEPLLEELLFDGQARQRTTRAAGDCRFEPDATGRVVALIDEMMKGRQCDREVHS